MTEEHTQYASGRLHGGTVKKKKTNKQKKEERKSKIDRQTDIACFRNEKVGNYTTAKKEHKVLIVLLRSIVVELSTPLLPPKVKKRECLYVSDCILRKCYIIEAKK